MIDNTMRQLSVDESFKAATEEFTRVYLLIDRIAKNTERSFGDFYLTLAEFAARLSLLEKRGQDDT